MSALGDNGNYDVIPIAVIETEQLHSRVLFLQLGS